MIALAESFGDGKVALVAHGHILRALSLVWLGLDFAVGEQFPLQTAALSVLGPNRGERALLSWNR